MTTADQLPIAAFLAFQGNTDLGPFLGIEISPDLLASGQGNNLALGLAVAVVDLTALGNVDAINMVNGSQRFVDGIKDVFVLDKNSPQTIDGITSIAAQGGGRWLRVLAPRPERTNVLSWFVEPVAGLDTNAGTSALVPLKTMREAARRLYPMDARNLVTVNLLSNITDASDFFQPMATIVPQGPLGPEPVSGAPGTGPFAPLALKVKGARTTTAVLDPNTGSLTTLTMTADATPPTVKATTIAVASNGAVLPQATINVASTVGFPTAGRIIVTTSTGTQVVTYTGTTGLTFTGCTGGTGTMSTGGAVWAGLRAIFNVTGFDFTPFIGQLVEILTSPVAAAVGMICSIHAAPALGIAYMSPLMNFSTHGNLPVASYVGTSTTTFRIYSLTTWAPHASPGMIQGCQIDFEDVDFTASTVQTIYNRYVGFTGCIIRRPLLGTGQGGEGGNELLFNGCVIFFAAPPGGRTPTQIKHTNGEARYCTCALINVDIHVREGDAKTNFVSCVATGSQFSFGGPNDENRAGSLSSLVAAFPLTGAPTNTSFGLGIFDWPAHDLLAPAAAATRGSTGAAVTIGHGAHVAIGQRIYGDSATANSSYLRVREGAKLLIVDKCTSATAPANPPSPGPAFLPLTLVGSGVLGQIFLDEPPTTGAATPFVAPTQISGANLRGVLDGSVAPAPGNFVALTTFAQWEDPASFARNVVGVLTGAAILNEAS